MLVSSIAAAQPELTSGNLRPIALFASRRFPTLPDLPTIAETLPGTDFDTWFSVVAPKGTPAEAINRVNKAIGDFLQRPETKQRLYQIGLDMGPPKTPAQSAEYIRNQQEMWRKLAAELGVEPQ